MPSLLAAAQVRAAVIGHLIGATDAGADVSDRKPWPTAAEALPVLRVAPGEERIEGVEITWPRLQQHELELLIEGRVRDGGDVTAALDALVAQVLAALLGSEAAAHLEPLPGCELEARSISRLPTAEGQAATGRVLVRLLARYQTVSNDPTTLV